jgi:hypothetical protein
VALVASSWWLGRVFDWGAPQMAEPAAAMVDKFNRIAMRTLRGLTNLRKVPLAVVVQNAGQVNVGGQQVNVAPDTIMISGKLP